MWKVHTQSADPQSLFLQWQKKKPEITPQLQSYTHSVWESTELYCMKNVALTCCRNDGPIEQSTGSPLG